MKILYHHRTQGEEPESIHIQSIVNALRELGHEVVVVGPSKKELGRGGGNGNVSILSRVKKTVPAFCFELLQIGYNLVTYLRMRKAIRNFKPDFIYERYALYNFGGIAAAKHSKTRLILEVNTAYATAWAKYFKIYFQQLADRIEKNIFMSADALITVTSPLKKELEDKGVRGRIEVMQNAIDLSKFDRTLSSNGLKKELGYGPRNCVVGFVGSLNKWHGIDLLMAAIPRILKENKDVRFLIVGDGLMRGEFQEYVKKNKLEDCVKFVGKKPHQDIPQFVGVMDIGLMPNSNDYGSPMKIFEYMAMGKVVVAPELPTITEVIDNRKDGILFPALDVEKFAGEIADLSKDSEKRRRIGTAAYQKVSTQYTWLNNARGIIKLYDEFGRVPGIK